MSSVNVDQGRLRSAWRVNPGVVVALAFAVLIGLVIAVAPLIAIAAVAAMIGAGVILRWPQVGFCLALALSLQAIPGTLAPDIPLGFFKLKLYELAYMGSLAGVFFQHLGRVNQKSPSALIARREWTWGLATFSLILLAALYSRYYLGNTEMVLANVRPYLALLGIALAYQLMIDGMPWQRIDQLLLVCGLMVSVIVIIQLLTGFQLMDARVEDLGLSANTGITRSITGVGTLAQAYAIYRLAQLALGKTLRLPLRVLMAGLLLVAILGLLGTFTRGAWIATALGAMVAAYVFNGGRQLFKVVMAGTVVMVVLFTLTFIAKPRIAEAMVDRALSVTGEIENGASFDWRKKENSTAVDFIVAHPLMGTGLGGAYKGSWNGPGSFVGNEFFIHNGYLSFPLFMGLLGVGLLVYLLARMLRAMLATRRSQNPEVTSVAAGVFVVTLISNFPGPVLGKFAGLLVVFSLIAMVQIIGKQPAAVPASPALL